MIPPAVIGPAYRANLRQLRAQFEAAYEAIEDMSNRTSPEFIEADLRYRIWIKAIDGVAMALLDDIDAMEASMESAELIHSTVDSPAAALQETPDLADLFSDVSDFERTRELVGTPAADVEEERFYEES